MKVAIASGKGGTGKTTLSTNLASLFAESGEVVLADLDVEEPNSGLFIRGVPIFSEIKYKMIPGWEESTCILCGNCQEVCNFHAVIYLGKQILVFPELCHSCYACSELCPSSSLPMVRREMGVLEHSRAGNIIFIESRLEVGQEQAVPLISETIRYVDRISLPEGINIYDAPPGTSCPVIEATKDADLVILVTEPTPFGLHDLSLAVDTMIELNKEFVVVINRYGIGNEGVENYCRNNDIQVIGRIPNSRKVAELYSRGLIINNSVPEFRKELKNIGDYIIKRAGFGNK